MERALVMFSELASVCTVTRRDTLLLGCDVDINIHTAVEQWKDHLDMLLSVLMEYTVTASVVVPVNCHVQISTDIYFCSKLIYFCKTTIMSW